MLSALSSIANSPLKIAFAVLCLTAVGVVAWLLKRGARKTSASTSSWKSYIGGQGTLLFGFLLLGGFLAWASSYLGPHSSKVIQGKMIEYHLDPSKGMIVEEQDVRNFSKITVITQTAAPRDGSATITIYAESTNGGKHEIGRIDATAGTWFRWDQQDSIDHLTMTVAAGSLVHPATLVDVFVFMSAE
jgi:hypothetical protein